MPVDNKISVTLSEDSLQYIRMKIASGEYASESEVLQEGIAALQFETMDRERFEREVVLPAHDELVADPSSGVTDDQLGAMLEERRRLWRRAG